MSTKHTQGEWGVSKHANNDSFGVYAEGNANDLAIVKGGNEEGGETESNAKLIAAAPELLLAAIKMKNHLDYPKDKDFFGALDDLNAAINKATN